MIRAKLTTLFLLLILSISCNPDSDVCTCNDLLGNTYQRDFDELNVTFMTADTARIKFGTAGERVAYETFADSINNVAACVVSFDKSRYVARFSVENFDCNSFSTSNDNVWTRQ